jgi:thiamine biosynthesis lipoprotein ApbE
MSSRDLTPKQASDLHQEVHRMTMYINKLANRMAELQFAPDDKLFRLVQDAERSLAALSNETYAVRTQLHPRTSKRSSGI